jgi:tRNA pseudouridine55 synthase
MSPNKEYDFVRKFYMNGFINVLKPPGMTSHDVISWLRHKLGIKKIGHGGTLDPDGAGVLVVAVGQATRLLEYLMNKPKSYRCEICFGVVTDTQDLSGKVLEERQVPSDYRDKFANIINDFVGEIHQIPPMVSAVHYKGKRLYELARKGLEVERKPRKIKIYSIEVVKSEPYTDAPKILFDVCCSKGTYIRTLCYDIGEALGFGATMSYLLRTSSYPFKIEQSFTLEEISTTLNNQKYDFLLPYEFALQGMPRITVNTEAEKKVLDGVAIQKKDFLLFNEVPKTDEPLCIYNKKGRFLAIGILEQNKGVPRVKLCKVFKNEG